MKQRLNYNISIMFVLVLVFAGYSQPTDAMLKSTQLKSHRADYLLSFGSSDAVSGISGISGKVEYEFSGSECDGYTTNVNFLINVIYDQGGITKFNSKTSTFENFNEGNFQFAHNTLIGSQEIERVHGFANRSDEKLEVEIHEPRLELVELSGDALFPTEHILKTIEHALSGTKYFLVDTYDGTEDGKKIYATSTFIGNEGGSNQAEFDSNSIEMEKLSEVPNWPVTFSYFDKEQEGEQTPIYVLDVNLYENGVHSNMLFKYPEYSFKGKLVNLEFFPDFEC